MPNNDQAVSPKWFKVDVPKYKDQDRSYLRLGSADKAYESQFFNLTANADPGDAGYTDSSEYKSLGWVEYTDGARFVETKGNRYTLTRGNEIVLSTGDAFEFKTGWFDFEVGMGAKFESFLGLSADVFVGGKFEANLSASVTMNAGLQVEYGRMGKYESVEGPNVTLSREIAHEADSSIQFSVDPDDAGAEWIFEKFMPLLLTAGGITTSALSTIGDGFSHEEAKRWKHAAGGTALALYLAGNISAGSDSLRRWINKKKKTPDQPRSEILMDREKIEIKYRQQNKTQAAKPPNSEILMDKKNIALSFRGDNRPDSTLDSEITMDAKKIQLKCGQASIILEKNKITLNAETIVLKHPEENVKIELSKPNIKVRGYIFMPDHTIHAKAFKGGLANLGE
jgi:hypothetical protein